MWLSLYGLFKMFASLVLEMFYHTIEVHGGNRIPPAGEATIIIANHSNAMTGDGVGACSCL